MVKSMKLKKIVRFHQKSKIKAGEGKETGAYKFFTSSPVQSKYLDYFQLDEESLVFGTGGLPSIHYINEPFSVSTDCLVIGINNSQYRLKYVYYYLIGNMHILENGFKGAGLKHISKKYIEEIEIPLLNITLQNKIIELFDLLEQVIYFRKSQIAGLDALIQSTFIEMFGDPNEKSTKFELKALKDLGNIITGNTPSRKVSEYYGDYIEWIKSDNINTPSYTLTKAVEFLSEKGKIKGRVVPKNSILVTCIAGSKSCIGNAAIADREVAFNQQINAIIPNGDPYFLYTQFLVCKNLVQAASTNGMKGLVSKGAFQQIQFVCPPIDLQIKFGDKFLEIQKVKEKLQKSLNEIEKLYNSLFSKAFKGELF